MSVDTQYLSAGTSTYGYTCVYVFRGMAVFGGSWNPPSFSGGGFFPVIRYEASDAATSYTTDKAFDHPMLKGFGNTNTFYGVD